MNITLLVLDYFDLDIKKDFKKLSFTVIDNFFELDIDMQIYYIFKEIGRLAVLTTNEKFENYFLNLSYEMQLDVSKNILGIISQNNINLSNIEKIQNEYDFKNIVKFNDFIYLNGLRNLQVILLQKHINKELLKQNIDTS